MGRRGSPRFLSDGFGFLTAVLAAVVAVAVVATAFHVARTVTTVSSAPLRDLEVRVLPAQKSATGIAGQLARGERFNVLLLGYAGGRHAGAFLTDSLMVVSIDPARRHVTMLSIPRDLRVTLPASRYTLAYEAKVNEAFSIGAAEGDRDEGMRVARGALEAVLGIRIDRTVAVDFSAFRSVVDAIGGIDVTVDRAFAAAYPRNDDPSVDDSWILVSFREGRQHFDGETALRFVRARYSDGPEGSDFARAARQQKVMLAVKEKVLALNAVPRLFGLLDALRANVRTDLSIADLSALAEFGAALGDERVVHAALSPLNVLQESVGGQLGYALLPKVADWREVHAYVRRVLEHPASLDEEPVVVVRAAARRASTGAAAVRRLTDLGFVARLELAGDDPERTVVADGTARAPESARFLARYFGEVEPTEANGAGALVVHLGRDWVAPRELVLEEVSGTSTQSGPNGAPAPPSATPAPTPKR